MNVRYLKDLIENFNDEDEIKSIICKNSGGNGIEVKKFNLHELELRLEPNINDLEELCNISYKRIMTESNPILKMKLYLQLKSDLYNISRAGKTSQFLNLLNRRKQNLSLSIDRLSIKNKKREAESLNGVNNVHDLLRRVPIRFSYLRIGQFISNATQGEDIFNLSDIRLLELLKKEFMKCLN